MKIRLALAFFLVFLLALTALGCSKVTGGGWSYDKLTATGDYPGNKVTFGFNVQPLGPLPSPGEGWVDAAGNLQLNDRSQNIAVHGTSGKLDEEPNFRLWYDEYPNLPGGEWTEWFLGVQDCTVNGKGGYYLYASIWFDEGEYDSAWIYVHKYGGGEHYTWEVWELQKGSIKIHDK